MPIIIVVLGAVVNDDAVETYVLNEEALIKVLSNFEIQTLVY